LVKGVLKATKLMEKFNVDDPDDAERIENIQELIAVAGNFGELSAFLENAALIETEQSKLTHGNSEEGAVTLMTLHAAKGLEFAFVFMVGMEEGIFPHSRSLLSKQETEEERRLCYVGITRAKEKLYLLRANSRYWFGRYQQNPPSRFLDALPPELTEYKVDYQTAESSARNRRRYADEFSDLPF
jgi:DNA helicase-2/ATP-dependent DNA helicase PcrA